jgi:Rrf2 family protein
MKFSAQEEYGLRCLLQIAAIGETGSVTIPEISRQEGLSPTHVAKLLMILRKEGFISSTRGQAGGYSLARPAHQILVGDVLATLGGKLFDDEFCGRHSGQMNVCARSVDCSVRSVWQIVQNAVDQALAGITVADLIKNGAEKNVQFHPQRPASTRRSLNA